MKKKKLLSLLLSLTFITCVNISTYAISESEDEQIYKEEIEINVKDLNIDKSNIQDENIVLSEENKKIDKINCILDNNEEIKDKLLSRLKNENTKRLIALKSIKVFVKETIDTDPITKQKIVIDSRLLTKKEVENLLINSNVNSKESIANNDSIRSLSLSEDDNSSYHNLTVYIWVAEETPSGSRDLEYIVEGKGIWSHPITVSGSYRPDYGDDFIGLYWGGSFACENLYEGGQYTNGSSVSMRDEDHDANKGHVWAFEDYYALGNYDYILHYVDCGLTLYKNNEEGEDTEITCKYVHTWASANYSASISSSPGFSVSPTSRQWQLTATVTCIPY